MRLTVLSATPTVDTSIYASGDHLGSLMTLSAVVDNSTEVACLDSLTIIDKSKQKSALDVLFFSESPTIASSDNAALDITDAEMASKFLGVVSVAAADYKDLSASSVASIRDLRLYLKPSNSLLPTTLYALMRSAGTPTYAGTTDLVLKFGFQKA